MAESEEEEEPAPTADSDEESAAAAAAEYKAAAALSTPVAAEARQTSRHHGPVRVLGIRKPGISESRFLRNSTWA